MISNVDHLVYATPDLDAGIASVEHLLGCTAVPGGRHEDWGTRNALISLGDTAYLEIIGPDPESTLGTDPMLFGIDRLDGPGLVTWAAKGTRLADLVTSARAVGVDLGRVSTGSRALPDGSTLAWELTDPFVDRFGGVVPFFIDWGESPHPAAMLPGSCELVDLTLRHPDADAVERSLRAIGVPMDVTEVGSVQITATIRTSHGVVELSQRNPTQR